MKIAILGTGLMGSALATSAINSGYEVAVYNRTASKAQPLVDMGAKLATTASEAIVAADATILVLLDGKALKSTLFNDEVKAALRGKKLLNASTTSVSDIMEVAEFVEQNGGSLAEMSIMVGPEQLGSKKGVFMLACSADDKAFWEEILASVGESTQYLGETGSATKAEAPVLLASMMSPMTLAYAVAVAKKFDVPQEAYAPIMSMMFPGAEYFIPNMMAQNYEEVSAAIDSYTTGLATAIEVAKYAGLPTGVMEEMKKLYEEAANRGYAKKDATAVIEVLINAKQ